jgi:hypothetical protein
MFNIEYYYLSPNVNTNLTWFFFFQLCIQVEYIFGILVQQWSILRAPMPLNLSIEKIIALVNASATLHNFCIKEQDGSPYSILAIYHEHFIHNEGGYIGMVSNDAHVFQVPEGIMDCGHHFQDLLCAYWRVLNNDNPEEQLPQKIARQGS